MTTVRASAFALVLSISAVLAPQLIVKPAGGGGASGISGAVGGAGTFLRSNGTNWTASALTLPNTMTANFIPFMDTGNAVIGHSGLLFDGLTFQVTGFNYTIGKLIVNDGAGDQFKIENDASNYLGVSVGATGATTFNATGAGAAFTFSDAVTLSTPLARTSGGIGATSFKSAGIPYQLTTSYIDPTGTAGADNTAQTVKSINIDAGTLTQVGDRIHIAVKYKPDTGTALAPTMTVNGVTTVAVTATATDASMHTMDTWLSYIDATHANVTSFWRAANAALAQEVANSGTNVASFAWASTQAVNVAQNLIANNHITVYEIVITVYPKGV